MTKKLDFAASFTDLEVYKKTKELSHQIYIVTKTFPKEERYSLTDQIRRSSRSIGAQIAESWGKRRYINHFVSKLTDADAENYETQHWIDESFQCNYINEEVFNRLLKISSEIGRMINTMILKADSFCKKQ